MTWSTLFKCQVQLCRNELFALMTLTLLAYPSARSQKWLLFLLFRGQPSLAVTFWPQNPRFVSFYQQKTTGSINDVLVLNDLFCCCSRAGKKGGMGVWGAGGGGDVVGIVCLWPLILLVSPSHFLRPVSNH